jgi:hypothetical protein
LTGTDAATANGGLSAKVNIEQLTKAAESQ